MKCSIEVLYHFHCQYCQKWWSFADIPVVRGAEITCPHCGKKDTVWQITNGFNDEVEGIKWVEKDTFTEKVSALIREAVLSWLESEPDFDQLVCDVGFEPALDCYMIQIIRPKTFVYNVPKAEGGFEKIPLASHERVYRLPLSDLGKAFISPTETQQKECLKQVVEKYVTVWRSYL